ncbi:MAG: hypothetical protein MUQ30_04155 [Anaerolineae bacterium]|nr:hypothetical protein [Anaerolineae bacterium]
MRATHKTIHTGAIRIGLTHCTRSPGADFCREVTVGDELIHNHAIREGSFSPDTHQRVGQREGQSGVRTLAHPQRPSSPLKQNDGDQGQHQSGNSANSGSRHGKPDQPISRLHRGQCRHHHQRSYPSICAITTVILS